MSVVHASKQNRLLAGLPANALARLVPHLECVEMPFAQVLHESGHTSSHIYFPTTAIVSLLHVMDDGTSAAIAMVGREGLVGLELFIGGARTPDRAVVQCTGAGVRVEARFFRIECDRAGPVLDLMLLYTKALIAQMVHAAGCNRRHSLEQRFCRWLLSSLDRLSSRRIDIEQGLLSAVLAVGPEAIAALIGRLNAEGLIRHSNGCLELLDRATVERRSCECYALMKTEADRLLTEAIPR